MSNETFIIWEGVYDEFPDEDPDHVFDSDRWLEKIAVKARQDLVKLKANTPVSECAVVHDYPLPTLVALESARKKNAIRILDFGGGMGATYVAVAASIPSRKKFDFHIVECVGVCRLGREIFNEYENIHFHERLPDRKVGKFDIVHAGSSFQYVNEWQELLKQFASYSPSYIAFGNLLAGAIRPFVTYQNYYGQKIPVRFHNLEQVSDALEAFSYELVLNSLLCQSLLGKRQPLPLEHMPEECRLRYGCNLIYKRKSAS